MDRRFSVPVLILLGLCLVAVGFHFISDEMGLRVSETDETVHSDHLFILPGTVMILCLLRNASMPVERILPFNSPVQQPPSPPPNSIISA